MWGFLFHNKIPIFLVRFCFCETKKIWLFEGFLEIWKVWENQRSTKIKEKFCYLNKSKIKEGLSFPCINNFSKRKKKKKKKKNCFVITFFCLRMYSLCLLCLLPHISKGAVILHNVFFCSYTKSILFHILILPKLQTLSKSLFF